MLWQTFVFGGVAAITAEAITYPIDTSKTRLQVQGQVADRRFSTLKYRGMFHTLITVAREEGVFALFSGARFALLRQATFGTFRLGLYYNLKDRWEDRNVGTNMPLFHLVCLGGCLGSVGAFLTTPTEVMRVRAQAASKTSPSSSILMSFRNVYKSEGMRGLYRGAIPNAQRAAVVNGVEIPTYDVCKRCLLSGGWQDVMSTHLVSSLCAGVVGTSFSQPIDVARTRMMNQKTRGHASQVRLYKGVIDTVWHTVRHEGFLALWKGYIPTFCRLGPWNVIFFLSLEQFRNIDNYLNAFS